MTVIYLVLPLALLVVLAAVLAFVWATRRGQFDDLETPALRVLHDDAAERAALPERSAGAPAPPPTPPRAPPRPR